MFVAIFHYSSFLKGAYAVVEVKEIVTLKEISEVWKKYFNNPKLKVWKFKQNNWSQPHTGDYYNSVFDENMTIKQYIDFYTNMDKFPFIIFV